MSYKDQTTRDERARKSRERRVARLKQAELGMLAQSLGEKALAELQGKIERGEPLNLTVDQIIRLVTAGAELERQARGEPSQDFDKN